MRSWSPDAGAPALPAAAALVSGIALAAAPWFTSSSASVGVLLGAGAAAAAATRGRLRTAALLLAVVAAGALEARHLWLLPARAAEARARSDAGDRLVEVTGRLASPWSARGGRHAALLEPEPSPGGPSRAPLWLVVGGETDPLSVADVGDRIRVRGPLRLPPVDPHADLPFELPRVPRLVLKSARQVDVLDGPSGPGGLVDHAHRSVTSLVRERVLGVDQEGRRAASFLLALLVGETADLPPEIAASFRDGGVAHVLAISGFHVALVAVVVGSLLRATGLGVRAADAGVLAATALYVLVAGAQPPVLRSGLMIGVYLAARLLGRPTSPGQAMGLSAFLLLAARPQSLFDVSFLLTMLAVTGLAAFGRPLERALVARGLPALVAAPVAATLGAELAIFPVQAYVFRVVPFVGLLSNLVAIPLTTLILLLGFLVIPLVGFLPAAAGPAFAALAFLLRSTEGSLAFLDRLAAFRVVPAPSFLLASLIGAAILTAALAGDGRLRRAGVAIAVAACLFVVVRPSSRAGEGTATLTALDVGQGDAILLTTPDGNVLVDGGGSFDAGVDVGRLRLLPRLSRRGAVALEAAILTHSDPDHGEGLATALAVLPVKRFALPEGTPRNATLARVLGAAARRGLVADRVRAGDSIRAAGLVFRVLHPGDERFRHGRANNGSLVLATNVAGRRVLLTGDAEAPAERDLLARGGALRADVLKVPHHGSRTSSTEELLDAVSPRVAVLSAGWRNAFGHPHEVVTARYARRRVRLFRTDLQGDVELLLSAGRSLPVFPPRPPRDAP